VLSAEVAIRKAEANLAKARAILAQRLEMNRRKQELVSRQVTSAQAGEETQRDEDVAKADVLVAESDIGVTKALLAEARIDALRDISLDVAPGEVVALRGPSGSGKTTLLNVIACILDPSAGCMSLEGEVVYDGKWLHHDLRRLRLEKIGFIFQFLNAIDNVAIVLQLAGYGPVDARARAVELLD